LSEEADKKKKKANDRSSEFKIGARYNVLTDNPNQMTEPRKKKNINSDTENNEEQKQETSSS
jgi:hypothetical protein